MIVIGCHVLIDSVSGVALLFDSSPDTGSDQLAPLPLARLSVRPVRCPPRASIFTPLRSSETDAGRSLEDSSRI